MARNPLAYAPIADPQQGNPLSAPLSAADVWEQNAPTLRDAYAAAASPEFWVDAARQYGQAMLAGSTAPAGKGIRAFHGSPYDFDRFDLSKIGTGEGAQAYGHGLYFAGNEPTARYYRDALTKEQAPGHIWQDAQGETHDIPSMSLAAERGDPMGLAASFLRQAKSVSEAIADVKQYGPHAFVGGQPEMDATLQGLQRYQELGLERKPWNGRMYEVNLDVSPDQLLDWDKPLSEQPEAVRAGLEKVFDPSDLGYGNPKNAGHRLGGLSYNYFNGESLGPSASAALNQAGIPGIQYLDAGSRSAGEGSRNYVLFDDNLVQILRKYGLLGMLGGGGAAGAAYNNPLSATPQQ